tara:strand:- start:271 stop:807 length:537 start_codon:yes stop_codon:yes gene_type:complete
LLANALSVSRIFLSFPLLYSLKNENETTFLTISILFAAAATDLADGFIARHLGNVSRTGKMLDPLSDKVFLAALIGGLAVWNNFPLWLLVMLFLRDVCIISAGCYMLKTRGFVIAANRWGKGTTACLGFTTLSYVINITDPILNLLVATSALLIIISSTAYARTLRRTLRGVDDNQVY